jgi:hypothetical protein
VHNLARGRGDNLAERATFDKLENDMLDWMGDCNFSSEVFFYPSVSASICREMFVLPSFTNLFPLLDVDLRQARNLSRLLHGTTAPTSSSASEETAVSFDALPLELQVVTSHFVSSLHSLFQMMDTKEDIFSVGSFSKMLGSQLEQLSAARNRRKTASHRATLILVDRTLDMAGPASHSFGNLLDRVRAALPPLPGHANDVAVEMADLFGMRPGVTAKGALCPGCLADSHLAKSDNKSDNMSDKSDNKSDNSDNKKRGLLSRFVMDPEKSVVNCMLDELHRAAETSKEEEGHSMFVSTEDSRNATVDDLKKGVEFFNGKNKLIAANLDLLQRSVATIQALKQEDCVHHELRETFLSELIKSEDSAKGFLVDIVKLVRSRKERGIVLQDILGLLTYVYGLLPAESEFFAEDEDRLQSVFSEAVVQDRDDLGPALDSMAKGMVVDEILAHQIVELVFKRLRCLPAARARMADSDYHSLVDGPKYVGFIRKLMRDIYSDDRRDVKDLFHHSQGRDSAIVKHSSSIKNPCFVTSVNSALCSYS